MVGLPCWRLYRACENVCVAGSPNGLEVGWMDKQYDLGDWLNEPKATSPDAECSEANVIALSLAVEDIPVVNVPTDVPWSSTEDGTLGVDVNENVEDGVEVDLLSEAFKLLDKAGISVDDLVQFKQFIDDTETAQCETSVSSKLDPSDLLFTESGASSSDSGLDSLPSSSPQSPAFNVQLSNTVAVPPSEPSRAKSRRGRRSAPYSNKLPADRKERKKIQNKTAALKYRQKKKEETKKVFTEVEILEAKNKELKNKVESITQEINYLKDLMAEVFKAKLVSV